jgi:antitoxin component of MazEF toxin-antitoxin module
MARARVGRWGNNLAVRLPGDIVRRARSRDGEPVEIETQAETIVIRRLEPVVTLEELFRGKTALEWRAAYAGAYDWGADVGREIVEE